MQERTHEEHLRDCAKRSLDFFKTCVRGLSGDAIEKQRQKYGRNCFEELQKDTFGFRLRRAFINPFSVVLMVLAGISFFVDIVFANESERNATTVIIVSAMLIVSGLVRLTQELKSKKITDELVKLIDTQITVCRDGVWSRMEAEEAVVGDLIRLRAGDRVPADLRIVRVRDCFISESAITGESEIQEKNEKALERDPIRLSDYKNIAFAGTSVVNGSLEGVVIAVGKQTLYGEIAPGSIRRKRGYDQGANSIALVLIRFMVLLVPIVFIASGLTKGDWLSAFLFALSVAVGLTPELLPMVITACLAKGSFNMIRRQTVVKNVNAMQGFGNMDVLCIDKTGTLTQDTMLLEYYMDILGNESQWVLDCAYLNSFYHAGIQNHLDTAILKADSMPRKKQHYDALIEKHEKMDELPFDYSRRISSVLVAAADGNRLISKGPVEDVLKRCSFALYKGQRIPIDSGGIHSVHAVVDEMLEDGMKVLAIAVKDVESGYLTAEDEQELTLIGYIAFFDSPKKTAMSAIAKLNELQVKTKVLTGDNADVSRSVCRRLGLDVSKLLTGSELDGLSDNDAQIKIENTQIFAELSPVQKAKIVDVLQSNGHTVGFLADGMNDLPAVMQADVGISVDTAVAAVKECADVILLKKDLNVLESGIHEGRCAFANMSKYVKITASSNLGNIIAIVFASIFLPFFPMTSLQLLLLNLLYDVLCLVLPWDKVDSEMYCRPMEWSGKTLSRFMLAFGPVSSLFDLITYAFLFFVLCPAVCGGAYDTLSGAGQMEFAAVFQTGWFLESMWTQVLILHLLRTGRLPFLQSRPSMPVLTVTALGIIIFTLLAVTPVGALIGLTSLPAAYFAYLILTVLSYLFVVTLVKQRYIRLYHCLI